MKMPALSLPLPIRERLDNFVALPQKRQVSIGVGISIFLHFILLGIFAVWFALFPPPPPAPPVPAEKKSLTVVLTREVEKKEVAKKPEKLAPEKEAILEERFKQLPPEQQKLYIDVDGLAAAKRVTKQALFDSWRDSIAGSDLPGEGDNPLPSQDGRDDLPFTNFKNQQVNLGKLEELAAAKPNEPITSPAQPEEVKKAPPPKPVLVAKAEPPKDLKKVASANEEEIPVYIDTPVSDLPPPEIKPEEKLPEPLPLSKPEPELLVEPPPPPKPIPVPETPEPPEQQKEAGIVAAKTPPGALSTYAPHREKTKVRGGRSKRGPNGVDASASVVGRYKKSLEVAVGSRWHYYINERMSLIQAGRIEAVVTIDAKGKVQAVRIVDNTSNDAHAALIEQCIREAEFDPPPRELLQNGVFEHSIPATLY